MTQPHDYDCDCADCLMADGDVAPGATECRECGQVDGHAPGCNLLLDNAGGRFLGRLGPS